MKLIANYTPYCSMTLRIGLQLYAKSHRVCRSIYFFENSL